LVFEVCFSKNLKSWKQSDKNNGESLKKRASYGDIGFWAPQVFEFEGMFYMASLANENSESPLGPFTQTEKKAVQAPVKQIDPYVFIDDDGKKYFS
jgi:beta-xylosidase